MTRHRRLVLTALASLAAPAALAAQRKSLADPMRLGVEQTLVESGLASQFQKAFGRDTGVAVQLVPGRSAELLESLERGEIDAAMTSAPELELKLEKQGLAHDRRRLALGDLVLVGPMAGVGKKAKDPVGIAGGKDVAAALAQIAQAQARFVGAPAGTGVHLSSLALWRTAKVSPAAPWFVEAKGSAIEQAIAENAYALVDRGVWLGKGRKPLAVLVEGDARMATEVHVMRSFRVNHPAAKLFGTWVSGAQGRRVAGGLKGWKPAPR
ncbi:MAG: substrate-binding domain-containing protein [Rhizobacter sp.]